MWYRYTGGGGGQRAPEWVCYERSAHPASDPIDKAINIDVDPAPDGVSSINQSSRNHDANSTLIAPPSRVVAMWNRGMRRDWTWVGIHMEPAWVVLLDYRLLWFSALDTAILVLVSVAAVAGGLDASASALCYSLTAVVIGLQVMEAVMVIVVKPFTTLFSAVHTFGTLILTSLSAAAQLAYILVSRNNSSTSAMWLFKASACCNLAAVGVSAVKMALDLMHIFVSCRRRIRQLMLKRSSATVRRRDGDLSVVDVVDAASFSPSDREQQHQLGVEMLHTSQLSPSVVTSQLLSMESSNLSAGGGGSFSTYIDAINPSSFHSVRSAYLDGADAAAAAALGASNSSNSSPPRHQSSTPVADDLAASLASSTARAIRRAEERYWDPLGAARAATTTTTRITSARKGVTALQDDDERDKWYSTTLNLNVCIFVQCGRFIL